jgi:hypothetical protein
MTRLPRKRGKSAGAFWMLVLSRKRVSWATRCGTARLHLPSPPLSLG